jgi:predicted small metal-binding protein
MALATDLSQEGKTMKTFTCRDAGVDCDQKFQGGTDEEIMKQVKMHALDAHGIGEMSPDMQQKVQGAIRNEEDNTAQGPRRSDVRENKGSQAA